MMCVPPIPGIKISDFFREAMPKECLPFPLDQQNNIEYFYFARNGIWRGLSAAGIKIGDEILMPELNSTIEVQVVRTLGAVPVLYKIHNSSPPPLILRGGDSPLKIRGEERGVMSRRGTDFTPDWGDVESKVTAKTKIFYLIHYLGVPNDIGGAQKFCKKHDLIFFEDAAFGFLSSFRAQPLGSFGDISIIVFRKTVPVPNGAVLLFNEPLNREIQNPKSKILNKSKIQILKFQKGRVPVNCLFSTVHDCLERLAYGLGMGRVVPFLLKLFRGFVRVFGYSYVSPGSGVFEQKYVNWPMARISERLLERFDYTYIKRRMLENYRTIQRLALDAGFDFFPREIQEGTVPNEVILFFKDEETRDSLFRSLTKQGIGVSRMWYWNENLQFKDTVLSIQPWVGRGLVLPMHADLTESHFGRIFDALVESNRLKLYARNA